ncbi:MAG: RNA methyltransferase [Synechococcus lacustris]
MTAQVVVVLVEPAGPLNVGSVARLCANYEVSQLRLVAPRCDPNDPQARLMAVRGGPQLQGAQCFERLADALADCRRVLACSGRRENQERPHLAPAEALAWLLEPQPGPAGVALVFGREDHGLHNDELDQAGQLLRIPTGASYGSLNLSHAVAICLATLEQQRLSTSPSSKVSSSPLPPQGALEATLTDAEALLLEVGFLYPHTARSRMAKLRQLLLRAEASEDDVALLRGMVRQLRWASRHGSNGGSSLGSG